MAKSFFLIGVSSFAALSWFLFKSSADAFLVVPLILLPVSFYLSAHYRQEKYYKHIERLADEIIKQNKERKIKTDGIS